MEAPFFDDQPFRYDRRYPPLFFVAPQTESEEIQRQDCLNRVSREYYRRGAEPKTTHQTCMSNGMTMGEYAMQICVERNVKRRGKN